MEIGNEDVEISLFSTSASNDQWWGDYYSVNGIRYRDFFIKYWHLNAPVIRRGTGTIGVANGFINLAVSVVGVGVTSIGLFGVGKSLYDLFRDSYGSSSASSGDSASATLMWDKLWKSTIKQTAPNNSLQTEKVWFDKIAATQTYGSRVLQRTTSINRIIYSR